MKTRLSTSARNRPVRVGVIGLGQIALKAHLPGYAKTHACRLAAVYSLREEHARRVAAQYGIPHIYKDWGRLLESDHVDAVSICTPNFTHAPIALKALREGKHVLVEKPMAMAPAEAERMIRTARQKGRVLMVHHNMRFDPAVRTAERLLRKGVIGGLFAFRGSLTHRGPREWSPDADWFFNREKSGGGALMDLGPHVFDTLAFLLGEPVLLSGAALSHGKGRPFPKGAPEIHCACLMRTKGGAIGTVNLGWADTAYHNRYYFYGTRGTLAVNLAKGDPITVEFRDGKARALPALAKGSFSPSLYGHFIDCIRRGKKPWVSGEEGLKAVELIAEGYRLARERQAVSI